MGFSQAHEFKPVKEEAKEAIIRVFSFDRDTAQYVTDEGVEHHADITVKWNGTGINHKNYNDFWWYRGVS